MLDGLVDVRHRGRRAISPRPRSALAFGATLLGIVAGCMPGLSATLVITLLTTLTLKMQPSQAILVLVCAYNGAIYGGSRTAILLNIPGTAANAAACLDGYALARQGQAGRAMGIATTGSVVGTLFGLICLALFTPLLGEIALSFGAFEFFWLALLGVVMSGNIVAADPLKGWLAGFLGLFVACIGQEGMYAYERFSFGNADLAGGFWLIPVLVGAFGFSEVLTVMSERSARPKIMEFGSRASAHHGRAALLAHHPALRRDRRVGRHPAGRRRGHGGVVVLRDREAAEQGAGEIRQGLDRGPDGGGDRRQRLGAGRHHPGAGARDSGLGALRGAARRHDHPRRAGRADADGREPAVRLRRRRDGAVLHARHPVLRPVLHPPLLKIAADPAHDHDADHLRAVRDRLLFAVVAAVRRLHDARVSAR